MRTSEHINKYRRTKDIDPRLVSEDKDGMNGVFEIPYALDPKIHFLAVVSDGSDPINHQPEPWEHVSVRARSMNSKKRMYERVPNWEEMCWLKNTFFHREECVVQFHPPESTYVNHHPNVLHLWRWKEGNFPTPPVHCV